jgi:hypothetical protein
MKIVNFGQVVDLEGGTVGLGYQFTVLLPNGERISVATDEGTVRQLTEIVTGGVIQPGEMELEEESPISGSDMREGLMSVFGPGPGNGEGVMGVIAEEEYEDRPITKEVGGLGSAPSVPVRAPQKRQPLVDEDGFMRPPPAKTVPKDEMGYPIVSAGQGVPVQEDLIDEEKDPGESV